MDVIDISIDGAHIRIRLDWANAPLTCRYFCDVIENGVLDNATLFRVLDSQISVVQFGRAEGLDAPRTRIPHERTLPRACRHRQWTVSAARYDPGELYASFFVCMRDEPELDYGGQRHPDGQGFSAFGEVICGFETLQQLHAQAGQSEILTSPKHIDAIRILPLDPNTSTPQEPTS